MQSLSENDFDIELFINEIQNRPVLWDMSKREYSDRVVKKKAWEEICTLFIPDFELKTTKQKNEEETPLDKCTVSCRSICELSTSDESRGLKIQKKWKHIRDNYIRDRNKKCKSGSGASTSKSYLYSHLMEFLNPVSRTRPQKSPTEGSSKRAAKEKAKVSSEDKLIEMLSERINGKNQDMNRPDYNFFTSLLDDFAGIHPDYKMDAKMEIMSVIKKYRQMSKYSYQNFNQQGYFTAVETPSPSNSVQPPLTQSTPVTCASTSTPNHLLSDDTSQESVYSDLFADNYD